MAEEEILTEQVVSSKQGGGGMNPVVMLVIIVVAIAAVAVVITMGIKKLGSNINEGMGAIKTTVDKGNAIKEGVLRFDACKGDHNVADIADTKNPITVNLADGHYMKTGISLCVKTAAKAEVQANMSAIEFAVQTTLNRKKASDIIDMPASAKSTGAINPNLKGGEAAADTGQPVEEGVAAPEGTTQASSKKMGALVAEISRDLTLQEQFKDLGITAVYLPGLIVDVSE